MQKVNPNKNTLFQLISIPFLFVQFLFSFALAAILRIFFKPEAKSMANLQKQSPQEEAIDPQVMHIVDELGMNDGLELAGSAR